MATGYGRGRVSVVGRLFSTFLKHSKTGAGLAVWAGIVIVLSILVLALFAPFLAPYGPEQYFGNLLPPGGAHLMGTDRQGYDVFSRVLWGARIPLGVVALSTVLSLVIGLPLGLLSGYKGGRLDRLLVLIMDSVYAFPGLLLAIAIAAVIGRGLINISFAIAVVYAPTYFRVIRNHVSSVKQQTYVEAARALSIPRRGIIARYILPNVSQNIPVIFSINAADAILTEAGLAFLGLGFPPGTPDWGSDISLNWQVFDTAWWATFYPGLFILILATALTFVGEGLNDILNPLLRKRAPPGAEGR